MKARSIAGLSLTIGLSACAFAVHADDFAWKPTSAPPAVVREREIVASTQPSGARLGRPEPVEPVPGVQTQQAPAVSLGAPVITASYVAPARPLFRAQAPDSAPPPPPPGGGVVPPPPGAAIPGNELYNSGVVAPAAGGNWAQQSWGTVKDSFNRRCGQKWMSDHAGDFDQFCSPVSSPFLSEDPRSLTEVKPLFIYQSIPTDNPTLKGGNIEFFGLQARVALTERWSIVMNKFGGVAIQPDDKTTYGDGSGFSEIWIGPKYTFYRDETNNTAAAAGLTFQIPVGSSKVFQDTGSLSLSPYFSFAKSFGKIPGGFGSFNYMSTTGFAFGVDKERSDYFYSNFHVDFDVAGQHKFYPLIELNWIRYISNGNARALTFEGDDLANFGSTMVGKQSLFTVASGARYKVSECVQIGGAFEFPLSKSTNFNDFRVTFDVIFRY